MVPRGSTVLARYFLISQILVAVPMFTHSPRQISFQQSCMGHTGMEQLAVSVCASQSTFSLPCPQSLWYVGRELCGSLICRVYFVHFYPTTGYLLFADAKSGWTPHMLNGRKLQNLKFII